MLRIPKPITCIIDYFIETFEYVISFRHNLHQVFFIFLQK